VAVTEPSAGVFEHDPHAAGLRIHSIDQPAELSRLPDPVVVRALDADVRVVVEARVAAVVVGLDRAAQERVHAAGRRADLRIPFGTARPPDDGAGRPVTP
jgi:hypothetical protein